ncbi:unnamed protein product [Ixodes hexagonus]
MLLAATGWIFSHKQGPSGYGQYEGAHDRLHQGKNKIKELRPSYNSWWLEKVLQPLDIPVNRSFKSVLRHLWEAWMTDGEHSFTKTGPMRHATFGEAAQWVNAAWDSVSANTVYAGFKKAGLVDSVPAGSAAETAEMNYRESDDDDYEPVALDPEVTALFVTDSESEDFDGFS